MSSKIYIIGLAMGPVKIGHGRDVRERLTAHQVGNHRELFIHATFRIPEGKQASAVEASIHKALTKRGVLIRGEWFDLSPKEAKASVQVILDRMVDLPSPEGKLAALRLLIAESIGANLKGL